MRKESTLSHTIHDRAEARAWQQEHESGAPRIGEIAPDFELSDASGDVTIRLSQLCATKPVALIFGSFT